MDQLSGPERHGLRCGGFLSPGAGVFHMVWSALPGGGLQGIRGTVKPAFFLPKCSEAGGLALYFLAQVPDQSPIYSLLPWGEARHQQ